MTKKMRRYNDEFKEESIKLALNTPSVSQAAKDLGIPIATLYGWITQAKKSGQQAAVTTTEGIIHHVNVAHVLEENKQLKKQLARLEQEKAILKKAATYFAKELG